MKFILGTKKNMTQIFGEDGVSTPVTVLSLEPMKVTQVKTVDTDGYAAVQVGYGTRKAKNISKAVKGHVKDLGSFAVIKEFRVDPKEVATYKVGDSVDVSRFAKGDVVEVSATSKGKGFQGVVKRHGFKGLPRTHGQKHSERAPGSISGGTREGGRVPKGMRMAGRMGGDTITIKHLKVAHIDTAQNELYIEGALPGVRGAVITVTA